MRYRCTTCENCGAPLEIPSRSKRASCDYCQSLSDSTDLETLRWRLRNVSFQLELDLLDRNWLVKREQLMVRNSGGHLTVPSRFRVLVGGGSVLLLCLCWTIGFLLISSPVSVAGVLIGTPVAVWMTLALQRTNNFQNAQQRHNIKREELCERFIQSPSEQDNHLENVVESKIASTWSNPQSHRLLPIHSDASAQEISDLNTASSLKTLESELQRLEADQRRHSERFKLESVSDTLNLTTHTSSITLLVAPLSVVILASTIGMSGIPIAAALAFASFFAEVKTKQFLLERDFERRENYYNSERRRLLAQLEATREAA